MQALRRNRLTMAVNVSLLLVVPGLAAQRLLHAGGPDRAAKGG